MKNVKNIKKLNIILKILHISGHIIAQHPGG